jgi:hypothetical protein
MGIHNVTALKLVIANHDTVPLPELVSAINIKLGLSVESDNVGHHHRLDAGRMLRSLRCRVEAGGEGWWKWQKGKFDRSRKDIEKLMRLAGAEDPEAAAEQEQRQARERMQRVSNPDGAKLRSKRNLIEQALQLVEEMDDQQRRDFVAQFREKWPW